MDDAADKHSPSLSSAHAGESPRSFSAAGRSLPNPLPDDCWLTLAATLGEYTRYLGELLREGVSPQSVLEGSPPVLQRLTLSAQQCLALPHDSRQRRAKQLRVALKGCGAALLPITDVRYPRRLREIPDAPPWLFCRGSIAQLSEPQVAVVGARRASQAGLALATEFAEDLARRGYTICSGMALGIDGAAHRGALRSGSTVAVLGTGIDVLYPRRHSALAREIEAHGCLVSELPPGIPMHKAQFPRRNRIISGLAQVTVIVEAALPSGSLHTAASALEQGRDVLVFPWSVLHQNGAGCLRLLRDGALPITSLNELDDFFPLQQSLALSVPQLAPTASAERDKPGSMSDTSRAATPAVNGTDATLLELIGDTRLGLQALSQASGLSTSDLLARLGRLELAGHVVRDDGCYQLSHCKSCQGPGSC